MVELSKVHYPNDGELDKQLAFIDGYRSAENDTFGGGVLFGLLIAAMIAVCVILAGICDEKLTNSHANALLNSNEWKIATVQTITDNKDTVTTYKFVRVNETDSQR